MKSYKDITGDGGSNIVEQVIEQADRLRRQVAGIKHIVAVMSGKGGVGKSSVTVNLASVLALHGHSVGILDADINGPSIARMTGTYNQTLSRSENGLLPASGFLNLKIMSMDLFLNDDVSPVLWQAPTQKDAYTWRGMMEATAVREFISDTEWGELDFLMIDLPPGTDKLPNLIDLLPQISGTMIVTIPTGISQFVVGKSIHMAASVLNTPVIGLIENMCGQSCPHCGKANDLFQVGLGREQAEKHNIPFLGSIPFDSQLALCADKGKAFMESFPGSSAAISLSDIAAGLQQFVSKNERSFQ